VPLSSFQGETPNPLQSCPGYTAPAGLPVVVQYGAGDRTPQVTGHGLSTDGRPLEHCVFSETSYRNSDASQQELGRQILGMRDAVVLVPREPLRPTTTYRVSLTVDGRTDTWSFTVAPNAR
jgi:hypothetical protein